MYRLLDVNPEFNVVDIASGRSGWRQADVYTDIKDFSTYYHELYGDEKTFVLCNAEKTPFKDKQFDFVISSHILEHTMSPERFCSEMSRIGKRGYIEVPTPLWDNLVTGPIPSRHGHKWWVTFDDENRCIVINNKVNIVDKFLSMKEHNMHMAWFRDSAVTSLYWEDEIEIRRGDGIYSYYDNKNVNFQFDSNNIKRDKSYLFKFGSK